MSESIAHTARPEIGGDTLHPPGNDVTMRTTDGAENRVTAMLKALRA